MLYRSRRLEALFGGPLGSVSYAELAALVHNPEAAEAEDLDYKREVTADDDKKKEEFAKDLAAFANHIGGVLIVGMAEARGVPSKVMDTDVSDQLRRHLQQVAAANTAPPVRFDMRASRGRRTWPASHRGPAQPARPARGDRPADHADAEGAAVPAARGQ